MFHALGDGRAKKPGLPVRLKKVIGERQTDRPELFRGFELEEKIVPIRVESFFRATRRAGRVKLFQSRHVGPEGGLETPGQGGQPLG